MADATVVTSPDAGFDTASVTTFRRLDELGLAVTGQRLEPERAVLACCVLEALDSENAGADAAVAKELPATP